MRYGTTSHPKFRTLQRKLGISQYAVVGLLESLWMLAAQFTDDGDITRFTAQEICDYAGYEGDAESLIRHMVESRWLDRLGDRLHVHDFLDHAPSFIYERNKKRQQRQASRVQTCPGTLRDNSGHEDDVPGISAQSSVVESSEVHEEENTGASLSVSSKAKAPKAPKPQWTIPEGVNPDHWRDWMIHRKAKGLSNTPTAWVKIEREASKAGWSIPLVVQRCAETPWGGFEAEWVAQESRMPNAKPNSNRPELQRFEDRRLLND